MPRQTQESGATRPPDALHGLLRRIRFFYDPRGIWLFGSRTRDAARPGSDWDILVVVDDAAPDAVLDPTIGRRLQCG
ncbi:MAG TPA: nucleotidyltransferase domain-containing protein [Acetobacteraceae bacterium]|nr:nucleotidyltransferase domain-containing protein [Acetobacteraceae bacterium]